MRHAYPSSEAIRVGARAPSTRITSRDEHAPAAETP
jgi:hypothetical protein